MNDFADLHAEQQQGWDKRWQTNVIPFDKGAPHGAFTHFLKDAGQGDVPDIPRTGKALVPGCGRGYDVHALSLLGLETTGIEVSPKAVEEANKWIQAQPEQPKEGAGSGVVELGDFFKWKEGEGDEGKYDVFYDYTFLCALPPTLRSSWASTYARLARPGSILITLQFPLNDPDLTKGPPFSLSEELYVDLLQNEWEYVWGRGVDEEQSRASNGPEGRSQGGVDVNSFRKGRERIAIWKRK